MTADETIGRTSLDRWFALRGLSRGALAGRVCIVGALVLFLSVDVLCIFKALSLVGKPFPGFLITQRGDIDFLGLAHWTGVQAGLKYPDKLQEVEGTIFRSNQDLTRVLQAHPIGDSIQYRIQRGDTQSTISVASMEFTVLDLVLKFGPAFLIGNIYFFLALCLFALKPDAFLTWVTIGISLSLGYIYIIEFDVLTLHSSYSRPSLHLAYGIAAATSFHLSLLFPQRLSVVERWPSLQVYPYLVSMMTAVGAQLAFPDHPLYSVIYLALMSYVGVGALLLVLSSLWTFVKGTSVLARTRAQVILLGALLALPVPAIAPIISFFGLEMLNIPYSFTEIPLLIFPVSVAYAIAKHNLFDVDVYIKRAVGYMMMTAFVALGYLSTQTVIRTWVLSPLFGERAEQIYPLVFALLVVFFFNPVFKAVQGLVDAVFFRKQLDYKTTVTSVSNALTSLLEEKAIIRTLLNTVRQKMFIDSAGVLLLNAGGNGRLTLSNESIDSARNFGLQEISCDVADPLVALVGAEKKFISKYDLAENPHYAHLREEGGKRFAELGASLILPLLHQDEVIGLMTMGYKKSGHFFTREDVELLSTLANQGAVALENAQLIEKMKEEEQVRGNLARYLSPQIVERVMKKDVQVNLGGDRKVVTILFSDIRNFTTISESWPPEQLVTILNEYFTAMAQIIFEYQGSLDKYIGDAIVSVFGSLIPLDNPAISAVRASVAMMHRMKELNAQWEARYGLSMEIGIGVSTGEVFLGNVGSPDRMEFTVIGDTVNVASRFSGLAHAGQVLVTRETFSKLGRAVPYKKLPPARVKGKAEPLDVFEITLSS